ncbi:DUF4062 domain-containing protein [Mangrovivirga cuniculi]|uniref:DUF4062 domain-containing protein n=1 Tax=Mangrovivirga cuniculi TaxID=2715131 RepID=A0A4D7JH93_9BACT|nr:DUF4062 domain-containing protein [Mangrovivirga cuniculi]QCK14971.1 hypothetical protein DCC35_09555 [Mangrovivirga cuniculi]
MKETCEIILCYSEVDNSNFESGNKGWIDQFVLIFQKFLDRISERKCIIHKLSDDEDAYEDVDIFIPVISPNFLQSETCQEYLRKHLKRISDDPLKNSDSVYALVYLPVFEEELNNVVKEAPKVDFFELESFSDVPVVYESENEEGINQKYWSRVSDLSSMVINHIRNEISMIDSGDRSYFKNETKNIYVANVVNECLEAREALIRDLKRHGYNVYPKGSMPDNKIELSAKIKEELSYCSVSVHMLGGEYGHVSEKFRTSISELEHDLSLERANQGNNKFKRIVWLSTHLTEMSDRQRFFAERVIQQSEDKLLTEIVDLPLAEFKSLVRKFINSDQFQEDINLDYSAGDSEGTYLMYSDYDKQNVVKLKNKLNKLGVRYSVCENEGNAFDTFERHKYLLNNCSSTIIFNSNQNKDWITSKLRDVLKSKGLGRSHSYDFNVIYTPECDINTDLIDKLEFPIILQSDDFERKLEGFLAKTANN